MMMRSILRKSGKDSRNATANVVAALQSFGCDTCRERQLLSIEASALQRHALGRRRPLSSSSTSSPIHQEPKAPQKTQPRSPPLDLKVGIGIDKTNVLEVGQKWLEARRRNPNDPSTTLDPKAILDWINQHATDRTLRLSQVYNTVLEGALIPCDAYDATKRAQLCESILRRIIAQEKTVQHRSDVSVHLTDSSVHLTFAFHKVMKAYCDARDIPSAERLLRALEELAANATLGSAKPTHDSYTLVLAAWAQRGAPREAEAVLSWMQSRGIPPSQANLDSCLNAWIKSGHSQSGPRAELLVLRMQDTLLSQPDKEASLYIQKSFVKVMEAWRSSKRDDAAERSEGILRLMQGMDQTLQGSSTAINAEAHAKITVDAYTIVMRTWCLSGAKNAPERIQALHSDLAQRVDSESIAPKQAKNMYASLLTAWARSRRKDASHRATIILKDLHEKEAAGSLYFSMDTALYNTALNAYANAGDGPRAQEILRRLLEEYLAGNSSYRPDLNTFNSVLLAWSKCPDRVMAAERAESVFSSLEALERQGQVKLNIVSYNALLTAMGETMSVKTALRGQTYFETLRERFAKSRDAALQPTAVTYTKAMLLWVRIDNYKAYAFVQALLDDMLHSRNVALRPTHATWRAYASLLQFNQHVPDKDKRRIDMQNAVRALEPKRK